MAVRRAAIGLLLAAPLAMVPMAVTTIATPAPSRAACPSNQIEVGPNKVCKPPCRGNSVHNPNTGECTDVMTAIKAAMPAPPTDAQVSKAALGGLPDLGILPDLNVPISVPIGLPGVVPDIPIILQPPAINLPAPPAPKLPTPQKVVSDLTPKPPKMPMVCGPQITPFFKPCI